MSRDPFSGRHRKPRRRILKTARSRMIAFDLACGVLAGIAAAAWLTAPGAQARPATVAPARVTCQLPVIGYLIAGDTARLGDGEVVFCTDNSLLVPAHTWHYLIHACRTHTLTCSGVPVVVRRELGIGHQAAVMVIGPEQTTVYAHVGAWGAATGQS